MKWRMAVVVLAVAALLAGGGVAWGDPATDNRGLANACDGPAQEHNKHCPRDFDSDTDSGGEGTAREPNTAPPHEQLKACVGHLDACDDDPDGDRTPAPFDECEGTKDSDGDGMPDACDGVRDPDSDRDGKPDNVDNCDHHPNPNQADLDRDKVGDACDDDLPLDDRDGSGRPDEVEAVRDRVIDELGDI